MKKIVFIVLVGMLCVSAQAKSQEPQYKIIANSYEQNDIEYMYKIKNDLIKDYKEWSIGVSNKDQVLADHVKQYNATYQQGVYYIVLGEGKGKSIEGELKVNYCESTKDIQKKSLIFDWLF